MAHNNRKYRLLFLISTHRLGHKTEDMWKELGIPVHYHVLADGTASGEIADMLGVGSTEKSVLMTTLPKTYAKKLLKRMRDELYLGTPNSGVAFTVPLSAGSAGLIRLAAPFEEEEEAAEKEGEKMEIKHTIIMAFVNQGFSEEVMAAARPAGARGGTVFHSRHVGSEESKQLWGITIQEEREIVLILASSDKKSAIMQAITEKCGMDSEAHGFVISMPVDNVEGLNKNAQ